MSTIMNSTLAALAAGFALSTWGVGLAQESSDGVTSARVDSSQLIADFARSHGLAAEHLAWANGTRPTVEVSQGEELKIPERIQPANTPEDGVIVNLAERGFYLYDEGEFQGFYPISIGQGNNPSYHTPTGKYEVISRIKNPEWHAPDSDWAQAMEKDRIDADSPDNPLGEYWFGIGQGYGFHENVNPIYTGDDVSHGCMRLYPEHTRQLYDDKLLSEGDKVTIVNRPVLTSGLETDNPTIAVFPSIYGVSNSPDAIETRLKYDGIVGMVSTRKLKDLSEQASGIPVDLLGSQVTVRSSESEMKGRLLDGGALLPTSMIGDLGLDVRYDGERDTLTISKGENSRTYPIDGESAHRWKDKTYLDARDVLQAFAVPFSWHTDSKTLLVGEPARG